MNQFFFLRYFGAVLLLFAVSLKMHSAPTEDSLSVRTEFNRNIHAAGNAAVQIQKKTIDSLSNNLDVSHQKQKISLKAVKDSLLRSIGKTLDPKRIESADTLHTQFTGNLNSYSQSRQKLLHERLQKHQHTIQYLLTIHLLCRNCKEPDDFENTLNTFQEKADHSTDIFFDAASDEYENASDALTDTTNILRDSLITFIETLVDDRSTEVDYVEEHASTLLFSIDARTPNAYLGRDYGTQQAIINPSIYFQHSSGFFAALGQTWMELQQNHWYGTGVGIGYRFSILPTLGAAVGYSGFWSKDSTTQTYYTLSKLLDAQVYYESPAINITAGITLNTSTGSDMGITLSCSHRWECRACSFEPAFSIILGKQEWDKEQIEITSTQQTDTIWASVTQTDLSMMCYQIDLPFNIRIGRASLTPTISYIIPVNVLENSRKEPYFVFGLTFMIDWIL